MQNDDVTLQNSIPSYPDHWGSLTCLNALDTCIRHILTELVVYTQPRTSLPPLSALSGSFFTSKGIVQKLLARKERVTGSLMRAYQSVIKLDGYLNNTCKINASMHPDVNFTSKKKKVKENARRRNFP